MNNIFGQPNNNCGCQENSYTRSSERRERRENRDNCGCHEHHEHHECHEHHDHHPQPYREECRQVAGTVFRINIPAGAEINILNLVELESPSGICLILRLPFLAGECKEC